MYGFVEKPSANIYDTVEIPTRIFAEVVLSLSINNPRILKKKLETLMEIDLIDDNSSIIINLDGVLNQEETLHILQVHITIVCSKAFLGS